MLVFESPTRLVLVKEIVEYLRLRALQLGIDAHPNFAKKIPAKRRNRAQAQDDALRLVAQELDSAGVLHDKANTDTVSVHLTLEERGMIETLLRNFRKTTLNNREQSKDPDKDHLYLHTATVIDQLLAKLETR